MKKSWILVADARRARCFERAGASPVLTELADFVHAQERHAGRPAKGDVSGDAGKGHGRTAHSGTQFEPRTDVRTLERHSFARELAQYINEGVEQHRCDSVVLIASAPMLGELRLALSHATEKILADSVARDLTHYQGAELFERIDAALAPAG